MGQNTVFGQVIKHIPRGQFEAWVNQYRGDRCVRRLDCWTWFGVLLFGQLTGHDSIRAIERVFGQSHSRVKRLGFGDVRRSTLADANEGRPVEILEACFAYVLKKAQRMSPKRSGFRFEGQVLALDTTIIKLCLNLSPWARYIKSQGGARLHTAIDIANDLPQFAVISNGLTRDITVAQQWKGYTSGSTVVFDRAFLGYEYLNSLKEQGVYFVTRAKLNCRFKVLESQTVDRTRGHKCDQIVYVKTQAGRKYKGTLRRISYCDPETKRRFVFLTNRFDLAAQTICDLYKARWKVELFFKTLKQNLKIRKFLGTSMNAVKAQILVALIAYLLVQMMRYIYKSRISIPDAMAVIGTLLLLREPIKRLLGLLPRTTRYPPDPQMSFAF